MSTCPVRRRALNHSPRGNAIASEVSLGERLPAVTVKLRRGALRATPRMDAPDGLRGANGVTARVSFEEGLVPPRLVANTRNRYRVPLRSPRTMSGLFEPEAWAPSGDAITR